MEKQESGASHGNPVLEGLRRRVRHTATLPWSHTVSRPPYPLGASITGGNWERRAQAGDYDWWGHKRGDAEWVLMQYTLAGEGRVVHHGASHTPTPGTLMVLTFPDDNHYWLPDGGMWEHFYLSISGREAVSSARHVIATLGPLFPLPADSPAILQMASALERLRRGQFSGPCDTSAVAYALCMALLAHATAPPPAGARSAQLERAVTLCRERYAEDIGVEHMAAAAGYSRYHFTRLFAQAYGLSPSDFLCDLRIAQGARLLRESDATVKDIARSCGFADAGYFCKVFRRATGTSPGSFRHSGIVPGGVHLVS